MSKSLRRLGIVLLVCLVVVYFTGLAMGQSAPARGAAPAAKAAAAPGLKEYHIYADWCGILILLWLVVGVALIAERSLAWWKFYANSKALAAEVGPKLVKPNREELKRVFAASNAPLAQVMTHVLKHETQESPETTLLLLDDAVDDIIVIMKKRLTILAAIANTGPFMGLLGTVLGIIKTFDAIGHGGVNNPALISFGIGMALNATAWGLAVAIPTFIAYNIFAGMAQSQGVRLRMQANRIFVALGDL